MVIVKTGIVKTCLDYDPPLKMTLKLDFFQMGVILLCHLRTADIGYICVGAYGLKGVALLSLSHVYRLCAHCNTLAFLIALSHPAHASPLAEVLPISLQSLRLSV